MDNTQKLQKMFWQLNLYFQAHFCPIVSEDVLLYCENNCIQPFYKTINDYLKRQGLTKRQLSSRLQDRKSIYNIYHQDNYIPTKRLAICIGLCLKLSKEDFSDYLHAVGYHLSCHIRQDVVVMFCLENGIYEGVEVDLCLEKMKEKPLFNCYF